MSQLSAPVALVTPRYAPSLGGVERHVEMLARGLAERGIGVEVLTADPTGGLPAVEELEGVLVRRFPTVGLDQTYFAVPSLAWWLARNARRFSLIHAHSYHAPLALHAAIVGRLTSTPLVLTPHYHGTGHTPVRRVLHRPYRPLGAWMLRRARRVICVSRTERDLVHRRFGPHVATLVVPNGVDADEITAVPPRDRARDRVLVLAVGRLEPYKRTDRLVEALPYLPPDHHALIVGDGPARLSIERLARTLGVQDRVELVGKLGRPELLAWYRSADVFVSLSEHEAFGLTVLEAAVAGALTIVSDIPAHREVAHYLPGTQVRFVRHDCSPTELARSIEGAASHASVIPTRPAVPTWVNMVDETVACYRAVLGQESNVPGRSESSL
ncbi:MAG: glycosyltransferase family 4 protein [Chloroflexota bacterium]|nr:glycosyltransferase family 4 protein [Chloroflexota bacterium]